ncbi:MAG: pyruvate formate-lyase-activating protein [Clostridia bacterium]|nr:pyruvate formate-lyase-activating protein [Clostridia bacterium]
MNGRIHSFESMGTVDGPGLRFIVFTQGCPLRCKYCHNPDTWDFNDGKEISTDDLISEIKKYKNFIASGGVTLSGGEPLMQPEFIKDILRKCKSEGIHTCVDTSGIYSSLIDANEIIELADLFLLDIKGFSNETFKNVSSLNKDKAFEFLNLLREKSKPVWIRYVLVPGLTDNLDEIKELASFLSEYDNIEKVEVLPFHKLGEYKWEALKEKYTLSNTDIPSKDLVEEVKNIFTLKKLEV